MWAWGISCPRPSPAVSPAMFARLHARLLARPGRERGWCLRPRAPVAAEPALTCTRGSGRENRPGAGGPVGIVLLELLNRPVQAAGSVPMAAAGDARVPAARRAAGVFSRDAGLPPQGCHLCLLPLSVGNHSGVELAAAGRLQHPGVWDGGCDSSQGFYFFFHAPRHRVYGTCVPGPPCCHRLCRDEVSPFAGFRQCCGEREEPCVCVSDKVMNHRSRGDISRAEGGVAVEPEQHSPAGHKQPLQGNGAGEAMLGVFPPKSTCTEGRNVLLAPCRSPCAGGVIGVLVLR